jgi:ABC-type dipeptide/oligopeptide/nickel transport system permease subunit
MLMVPAGFLVVLLVACNFVGDALRDAFDSREV